MRGGEEGEDVEETRPDDDEEEDDEDGDGPGGYVLRGPEVEPVAAVWGREPVVLDDDHDEEPLREKEDMSAGGWLSFGYKGRKKRNCWDRRGGRGFRTMMIFLRNREV